MSKISSILPKLETRHFLHSLAMCLCIVSLKFITSATGNSIAQVSNGTSQQVSSSPLPALSERSANVNSRYLSASSTASLAAATVAAANGAQTPTSASVSAGQDASKNFLLHQQQHHQSQQQPQHHHQQASVSPQVVSSQSGSQIVQQQQQQLQQQQQQQLNQQQHQIQQQQQLISTTTPVHLTTSAQVPQFNLAQGQPVQTSVTPVISTSLTLNPLTGQYVPSELSTSNIVSSPAITASNFNQFLASIGNQNQPSNNLLGGSIQLSQPDRFSQNQAQRLLSHLLQSANYQPLNFNHFGSSHSGHNSRLPQAAGQLTRRNGFAGSTGTIVGSGPRPLQFGGGINAFGLQQPSIGSDDENNSFYQQQLANAGLINGITSELNGFATPESSYLLGTTLNSNSNNNIPFVQQSLNNQQQFVSENAPGAQTPGVSTTGFGSSIPVENSHNSNRNDQQCYSADNRHGTCYQASECIRRGGTPMGKCGQNNYPNDISGSSYVCCLFDVTCGQFAAERFVYFRNPNYPQTFDQSRMCRAKIGKLDKGVCQFRLDLLRFDVAKPTNGNCSSDMFVVSGQNENYVIPKICGLNDGQHYYVGVDESGVITLHMMMMGLYKRSFEILITQIPCRSDYSAPAHCLQYFMGTHGTIKSFNYDDEHLLAQSSHQQQVASHVNYDIQSDGPTSNLAPGLGGNQFLAPYGLQFASQSANSLSRQPLIGLGVNSRYGPYNGNAFFNEQQTFGGYPNDLDYTMCIRKESGFCSITYQLSRADQGGLQPFAVGHSIFGIANETNTGGFGGSGWQPVSTECRDDYLLIGGVRLCSGTTSGQNSFVGDGSIQFAQNGSILGSAGVLNSQLSQIQLQQQLQSQYNQIMQQLAKIQQQKQAEQQQQAISGAGSPVNVNGVTVGGSPSNSNAQTQTGNGLNSNPDQQQAALIQQSILIQQQLNMLASAGNSNANFVNQAANNNRGSSFGDLNQSDLQGAIITDTTSGPFILRFVSNTARNARGFHIDFRQNPCK